MKRTVLAVLCGLFVMGFAACSEAGYYEPEETTAADETEEPTTEQQTLSSEEIADLLTQTIPASTGYTYVEAPEEEADVEGEFGISIFLVKNEEENTERYFFFYEDGNGTYLEQENGAGMGFTYELAGEEEVIFHIGAADDVTKANVYWIDSDYAEISWEDGTFESMTRLPDDPREEFHFYNNEVLRERAADVYQQKNGLRPAEVLIWFNFDETLSIQLNDEIDGVTYPGDWYTVDRYTGIGLNLMGERIDLSDNAGTETAPAETETVPGQTEDSSDTTEVVATVPAAARR